MSLGRGAAVTVRLTAPLTDACLPSPCLRFSRCSFRVRVASGFHKHIKLLVRIELSALHHPGLSRTRTCSRSFGTRTTIRCRSICATGFPIPICEEHGRQFLEHVSPRTPVTGWAIEVDGEVAGGIGLMLQTDVERVSAEIGYWLGEVALGEGDRNRSPQRPSRVSRSVCSNCLVFLLCRSPTIPVRFVCWKRRATARRDDAAKHHQGRRHPGPIDVRRLPPV